MGPHYKPGSQVYNAINCVISTHTQFDYGVTKKKIMHLFNKAQRKSSDSTKLRTLFFLTKQVTMTFDDEKQDKCKTDVTDELFHADIRCQIFAFTDSWAL